MTPPPRHIDEVPSAFEILLEEIETAIDVINRAGIRAFETSDYDAARRTLDRADQLTSFRSRVQTLAVEWVRICPPELLDEITEEEEEDDNNNNRPGERADYAISLSDARGDGGSTATFAGATPGEGTSSAESAGGLSRLQRGVRTPETAFVLPILQALEDLGGSARMHDVLNRVGELMTDILKDVDYQPLGSVGSPIRWNNTAQWTRYTMVQQGLLRDDSKRGTWAISDAGRVWLDRSRTERAPDGGFDTRP